MRRRVGIAVFGLAMAWSALGQAQSAADKKSAEALFRDGRAAIDKGDYPTACAKFQASLDLDPAVGTLLNLTVCEEHTAKLVAAKKHVTTVLAELKPKDERVGLVKELAAKIDARLPTLTLTLAPGAPADTEVRETGNADLLAFGSPILLDPGDHDLVVTASGRAEAHVAAHLAEGAHETREVAPGASLAAPVVVAPVVDQSDHGKLRRTLGFAAGGVGIAGLGVAIGTGFALLSKKSSLDAQCPNQACNAAGVKLLASDKSTALLPINAVGWVVGIVGLGAGATLVLTSRGGAAPKAAATLTPLASPTFGGLGVDARF